MAYASVSEVKARMTRTLGSSEENVCASLLSDAAVIIDEVAPNASSDAKMVVSCRMVIRALGSGPNGTPIGASQGSMGALGYTQSWTMATGGSVGELYLSRQEKILLGCGNSIGSYSPVQELAPKEAVE